MTRASTSTCPVCGRPGSCCQARDRYLLANQTKEHDMTAVEVAVKALIDITHDENADASVRCSAAQALLARSIEGDLVFAAYDDEGKGVAAD